MLPKILRIFGYFVAFVLFLLLFVRMTFPTDALGKMLKVRIADATGANDVKLADVSLLGLIPSGVSLEGLEISFPDVTLKGTDVGKDKKVGRVLQADLIELRAALGALSSGEIDASFEGVIMGGEIKGGRAIVPKDGTAELRIESMSGVALGPERLFAATTGFDILGTLSGSIDLKIPVSNVEGKRKFDITGIDGVIDLAISDTIINDPVVERSQMRQGLTDVQLGTLKLVAKAGGGGGASTGGDDDADKKRARVSASTTIQLEEFSASGPDVQVGVAPRSAIVIPPGRTLTQGTIRAHFAIQVADSFITREIDDPKAPGTKMQPNKIIKLLLEDLTRKGHVKDNDIGLGITGPMSKPAVTTEPPRTRIGASGTAGRRMNVNSDDEPEDDEGGDDGAAATPPPSPRPLRQGSAEITRPAIGGGRPISATPMGRRSGRFDPRNPSNGPVPAAPIAPPDPIVPEPIIPPEPMNEPMDAPMDEPDQDFNEDPAE